MPSSWDTWTPEPDPISGFVPAPPEPTLALAGNPSTEEVLAKQRARDQARLRSGSGTAADDLVASQQRWAQWTIAQHGEDVG